MSQKAPSEAPKTADAVIKNLLANLPFLINPVKGGKFNQSGVYQIRVNSSDNSLDNDCILSKIEEFLASKQMSNLGIHSICRYEISPNSSKFSSVGFSVGSIQYDIVLAKGSNKGQEFEKEMLKKLQRLHKGEEVCSEALAVIEAIRKISPDVSLKSIKNISARYGNTVRSEVTSPQMAGEIIADAVLELKSGKKKFVSLKNQTGTTIANFGFNGIFDENFTVDTTNPKWKKWVAPLCVDADRVASGLRAYKEGIETGDSSVSKINKVVRKNSSVYKLLQLLWGSNYIYLRKKGKSIQAVNVDETTIDNEFLKGMRIVEIRYPYAGRKQVTVIFENAKSKKFRLELRNTKGQLAPNQLNFGTMS